MLSVDPHYKHEITNFSSHISYPGIAPNVPAKRSSMLSSMTLDSMWNFLAHAGYLTFEMKDPTKPEVGYLSIPNQEIRLYWQRQIKQMVDSTISPEYQHRLITALREFDISYLKTFFDEFILLASYRNFSRERDYHLFYFSAFAILFTCYPDDDRVLTSDRESGKGHYDIMIQFRDIKRLVVFEFKWSPFKNELAKYAAISFKQIEDRKYVSDYKGYSALRIGVAFNGKDVSDFVWSME